MTTIVNESATMSTTATTPPMMAVVLSELDDDGWFPPPVGPTGTATLKKIKFYQHVNLTSMNCNCTAK